MPQPTGWVELEPASILLGVDHEHPTRPDGQVVDVGLAPRDGQVVQDGPALALQGAEQAGGASLPGRPAPPGVGVWAGSEPQSPAGGRGGQDAEDQAQPGCQQAAEDSPTGADAKGDGDPPGQGPGPGCPLG